MKKGINILLILCAGLLVMSCNKTKSYTDMLKAQKKAIDRFLDDEGYTVLKHFPKDTVFRSNEFYKTDEDIYVQVMEKGDGNKAVLYQTYITCRFTADRIMIDADNLTYYKNVSNYGPNSNGTYPLIFRYGSLTAESQGGLDLAYQDELLSEGLASGLKYVGNKGKVRLIVPFKRGGAHDQNSGDPVYFEIVEYKFE